jgi:hypothetical protein
MSGEHVQPCPDCRWTMYVLTGRPVVMLRCRLCRNWFHANVSKVSRRPSIVPDMFNAQVSFNHQCSKDDLNSMFRCDCLAKQLYCVDTGLMCDDCVPRSDYQESYGVVLRDTATLHHFILTISERHYKASALPAYSLQRRCGAIPEYLDTYVERLGLTEAQTMRTMQHRDKRLKIREALDARQNTAAPSTPSADEE